MMWLILGVFPLNSCSSWPVPSCLLLLLRSRIDGRDYQRISPCRFAQSFVEIVLHGLDLGILHAQEANLSLLLPRRKD